MNREEITPSQRSRLAYVYVRQSSPRQVRENLESQKRQRALAHHAVDLGWPRERVVEVDEDLGVSAARTSRQRIGFQDMVADVALGKIGLVLALEVSRLSRSNRDWYHLLDICAVTLTLIADGEGLYDPRSYNDRLLLGLKATMSEAELHVIKQRLVEAVRSKAKRGELRLRLPTGYTWDEVGRTQITPNDEVAQAIRLVFERFDQLGTVQQTHVSLVEDGIVFPVQRGARGEVSWQVPSYRNIHSLLTNPTYAGVYAYGRRQTQESLDENHNPVKRQREMEREQWHAFIEGHHPGYITLASFERNRQRITENRRGEGTTGAPREGESLLHGLLLCGRCGRKMKVAYGQGSRPTRYHCVRKRQDQGSPVCQSLGARRLEQALEGLVLEAVEPLGLEAMIQAAQAHADAAEAERRHWHQRIERAEYEVKLARRQYDAIDPENRLVARELERRFEKALQDLEAVRQDAEAHIEQLPDALTPEEEARLMELARDLPRLWRAPTTRPQDRTRVVRCLIDHAVVTVPEEVNHVSVDVHWHGGEISTLEVPRGRSGKHRHVAEPELIELVRRLAREFSDVQVAYILHRKRIQTPKGLPYTAHRVANLRKTHDIAPGPRVPQRGDDIYTAQQAGERLGVDRGTVIRWVEAGLLKGAQVTPGAPWRIQVSEDDVRRLTTADTPKDWLTLKAAAAALGVSQQTVLQKLKSGQLEGVRVQTGRRTAWRVRILSTSYDDQPTLFDRSVCEV
jgi:DNA invertase Pin-like site-specific DNA recombinase/predicted DNA-binding protein (UPF0251 family)